jgi:hypothetical protein
VGQSPFDTGLVKKTPWGAVVLVLVGLGALVASAIPTLADALGLEGGGRIAVVVVGVVVALAGLAMLALRGRMRVSVDLVTAGESGDDGNAFGLQQIERAVVQGPGFTTVTGPTGTSIGGIDLSAFGVDPQQLSAAMAGANTTFVVKDGKQIDVAAIASTGTPTTATVASVNDIGVELMGTALLSLELDVAMPDGSRRHVTQVGLVPEARRASVVAGATLPVRIAHDDPELLVVDWERA